MQILSRRARPGTGQLTSGRDSLFLDLDQLSVSALGTEYANLGLRRLGSSFDVVGGGQSAARMRPCLGGVLLALPQLTAALYLYACEGDGFAVGRMLVLTVVFTAAAGIQECLLDRRKQVQNHP